VNATHDRGPPFFLVSILRHFRPVTLHHGAPGSLHLASDVPNEDLALAEHLNLCVPFCIEYTGFRSMKLKTTMVFHLQLVRDSVKSDHEATEDYLGNLDLDDALVRSSGSLSDIASWLTRLSILALRPAYGFLPAHPLP